MSKMSGRRKFRRDPFDRDRRHRTSVGVGTAVAGDNNVTEDQILKALAPRPRSR